MLHLPTRLTVDLVIHNDAVGRHGASARLVLVKKAGESARHVLLKLLAYVLFYHPDLQVEASAGQHFKPDLVRFDVDGQPVQWVDCGKIGIRKLDRISQRNRRTLIDVVKATEGELRGYASAAEGRLGAPERVRFFAFADGFVAEVGEALQDRSRVTATVVGERDHLYLDVDGRLLDSPVKWFTGGKSAPGPSPW